MKDKNRMLHPVPQHGSREKAQGKIFYNNKGVELSAAGKYDEAEQNFKKALEAEHLDCSCEPLVCDSLIYYNIGFVLLKKGDKKEFIKWFDLALANANSSEKGALALDSGLACFEAALYSEAEKYYDLALSLGKSVGKSVEESSIENSVELSAEYHNRRGVLSFVTGKYEKAKEYFEKALSLEPNHADALYNLADTYEELGMAEKALETKARYSALSSKNRNK